MTSDINVLDDLQPVGDLTAIRSLALSMLELENQIAGKEQELTELKERHRRIQFEQLPELMQSHQVSGIDLDDGARVELDEYVSATIPAPSTIEQAKPGDRELLAMRRDSAMAWLREHNHGDIIKNLVSVQIPKGADALAEKLLAGIAKLKLTATRSDSVHPSTLKAFVKEQLASGTDIPFDLFGISVGKRALYSIPKPKKGNSK